MVARVRIGPTRFRHGDLVTALSADPKGQLLISGDQEGRIQAWDLSGYQALWQAQPHRGVVSDLDLGTFQGLESLATVGEDGQICLFSPPTGELREARDLGLGELSQVRIHPEGKGLALGTRDGGVHFWESSSASPGPRLGGPTLSVNSLQFLVEPGVLVAGTWDGAVYPFDLETKGPEAPPLGGHAGWAKTLVPVSGELYFGGHRRLFRWTQASPEPQTLPGIDYELGPFLVDPARDLLVSFGYDGVLRRHRLSGGKALETLTFPGELILGMAWVPLPSQPEPGIAVASGNAVRFVALDPLREVSLDPGPKAAVHAVLALSAETGVGGTAAGEIFRFDSRGAIEALHGDAPGSPVTSLVWDSKGGRVFTGHRDRWVRSLSLEDSQGLKELARTQDRIQNLAFSSQAGILAAGGRGGDIRLFSTQKLEGSSSSPQEPLRTLEGHKGGIFALALSPNGRVLVSSGWDRSLRVWDVVQAKELIQVDTYGSCVASLAFLPGGDKILAGSEDGVLRVLRLRDGGLAREHRAHQGWIYAVAVSPQGDWIASGGEDKTVRIWSWPEFKPHPECFVHQGWVHSLDFAPGGEALVSGGGDCQMGWIPLG